MTGTGTVELRPKDSKRRRCDSNPIYTVWGDGCEIGSVWYGAGNYWYTHKCLPEYPIGRLPEGIKIQSHEHLASWVYEEYISMSKPMYAIIKLNKTETQKVELPSDIAAEVLKLNTFVLQHTNLNCQS